MKILLMRCGLLQSHGMEVGLNIYSVGQVNSYIKNMFAQDIMLGLVYVRGEVSNLKYHSSGHIYFTLKDEKSSLACVMFAGNRKGLTFKMQEGQQIVASGKIEVYERDGKYQLYVSKIRQEGFGSLYEQFEQLKRKMEEMGMFAPEYKRPLPAYIHRLGVVTAPTGAAVRDIINISKRRNPYLEIILYPALVQGEHAAESIAGGIAALDEYGVDVIIAGRGGGSMEDLWAFNEEIVAQAIFDCMTPVISAVGHETDVTIADFVADMRAPTPSAAAELAVFEISVLEDTIAGYQKRLAYLWNSHFEAKRSMLEKSALRLQSLSPANQLNEKRTQLLAIEEKLSGLIEQRIMERRHQLQIYLERYKGLSPLEKLGQGYGYVADMDGKAVTDIHQVKKGDLLRICVTNGKISARVESVDAHRAERVEVS